MSTTSATPWTLPPPDPNKASIFIGTPAYDGVKCGWYHSTMSLRAAFIPKGHRVTVYTSNGNSLVSTARDDIAYRYLKSGESHAFLCDNDITFPPSVVEKMLARDAPFVVAAPPLRRIRFDRVDSARAHGIPNPNRFAFDFAVRQLKKDRDERKVDRKHLESGFVPIEAAGVAVALIRREVFLKMKERYPELRHVMDVGRGPELEGFGYFLPAIWPGDDGPEKHGEDMAFCRRWRDMGGEIELLIDATLSHEGPVTVTGNYKDLLETSFSPRDAR